MELSAPAVLGRLNEMPHVENKNDFSASPRAAPLALQGLFSQARSVCSCMWGISSTAASLLVRSSWSPGIIKVGKDQGAFCPRSSLLWSSAIPACPQHKVENRIIPKLPVLAALILHLGLDKWGPSASPVLPFAVHGHGLRQQGLLRECAVSGTGDLLK